MQMETIVFVFLLEDNNKNAICSLAQENNFFVVLDMVLFMYYWHFNLP